MQNWHQPHKTQTCTQSDILTVKILYPSIGIMPEGDARKSHSWARKQSRSKGKIFPHWKSWHGDLKPQNGKGRRQKVKPTFCWSNSLYAWGKKTLRRTTCSRIHTCQLPRAMLLPYGYSRTQKHRTYHRQKPLSYTGVEYGNTLFYPTAHFGDNGRFIVF